jgi:HPt (histidine-containing phosphotransfer) domain-containing protein
VSRAPEPPPTAAAPEPAATSVAREPRLAGEPAPVREEERNVLLGKVLSGTGEEAEVRRYFADRQRRSEEAIATARAALEQGEGLSDEERGLLELAITLHTARLAKLPARLEDALARQRLQAERRAAWRRSR